MHRPALFWKMGAKAKILTKISGDLARCGQGGALRMLSLDLAKAAAERHGGSLIQCKGCGELGFAFWEKHFQGRVLVESLTHRVEGNFYLFQGTKIACGRCQQLYRPG